MYCLPASWSQYQIGKEKPNKGLAELNTDQVFQNTDIIFSKKLRIVMHSIKAIMYNSLKILKIHFSPISVIK